MKIQILIPYWEEGQDVLLPLLRSIEGQIGLSKEDFGVILVNDGGVSVSEDFLKQFSIRIDHYKKEHSGVSATRNFALKKATAEYVMFCDADDQFANVFGLYLISQEIDNNHFDVLVSVFYEEYLKNGKINFILHENDVSYIHGKVYRRQFLLDSNISWDEGLTIHEDVCFNSLCFSCTNNVRYCPNPFYLWKYRKDSTVRINNSYIKLYPHWIKSIDHLVTELKSRQKFLFVEKYIEQLIFETYILDSSVSWKNFKTNRDDILKSFLLFYNLNYLEYAGIDKDNQEERFFNFCKNRKINIYHFDKEELRKWLLDLEEKIWLKAD